MRTTQGLAGEGHDMKDLGLLTCHRMKTVASWKIPHQHSHTPSQRESLCCRKSITEQKTGYWKIPGDWAWSKAGVQGRENPHLVDLGWKQSSWVLPVVCRYDSSRKRLPTASGGTLPSWDFSPVGFLFFFQWTFYPPLSPHFVSPLSGTEVAYKSQS